MDRTKNTVLDMWQAQKEKLNKKMELKKKEKKKKS